MRRLFICVSVFTALLTGPELALAFDIPTYEQVVASHISSDAVLVDRYGEPLADLRIDPQVRRLDWVRLDQLSASMRETLLVAEDKRFFEHTGVDWKAFVGALWHNLWNNTKRGASTLTMQLAGMLDPELRLPRKGLARRSFEQKWDQGLAARQLEARWTKSQILEAYLNLAPFRGDVEGIGAAAELILKKNPSQLTRSEAAILAVLLRGPNAKQPLVVKRACRLVEKLKASKLCPQIETLVAERLDAPRNIPRYSLAPHVARQMLRAAGERVQVSLDASMQKEMLTLLQSQMAQSNFSGAKLALVLIDPLTGEVRAWIGSLDSNAPDGVKNARPMIAPNWPCIYAGALERRLIKAATIKQLANESEAWHSVRYALSGQYSEPVKQVASLLLNDPSAKALLGVEVHGQEDISAVTLPQETSLLQMSQNWRGYGLDGLIAFPTFKIGQEAKPRRIFNADTAFIMRSMLADKTSSLNPAAAMLEGLSNWSVHSDDEREVMMVGGNTRLTLGVALTLPKGNNQSAYALANTVWQAGARVLDLKPDITRVPAGVTNTLVVFNPPIEVARKEWFLKGTETNLITLQTPPQQDPHITYPANEHVYSVEADPAQRLAWALTAERANRAKWRLDGEIIGEGMRVKWLPEPGSHVLELLNAKDERVDSVRFEVKLLGAAPLNHPFE